MAFRYNKTASDVAYDIRCAINDYSCGDTFTNKVPNDSCPDTFIIIDGDHTFHVKVTKIK